MQEQNSTSNFWKEILHLIILALVIVVPFRLFIAQPFVVEGSSMDPTFKSGDYLIVDELSYHITEPERGAVVVFKYPKDPKRHFIKRIIGLPGETVTIANGQVTITNEAYPNGFTLDEPYIEFEKTESLTQKLKDGEYFVMGDNRPASADSRVWGPVPRELIVGRPFIRFMPPGLFPGKTFYLEDLATENNE